MCCLAALSLSSVQAQSSGAARAFKVPDDVVFQRDIHYREGHDRWVLNVIRPKKKGWQRRSAIMLVHGGGWSEGVSDRSGSDRRLRQFRRRHDRPHCGADEREEGIRG